MKRRLFSIFAILLFVLSGCQKEPTSKYILPIEAQYFLGKESYESAKEHDTDSFSLDSTYANEVTLEEDCLVLEASDSQIKNLIENNQKIMEEIAQEFEAIKDNYTVEWSEDYSSVTFNVDDEGLFSDNAAEALENMGHTFWMNYILQANCALMNKDCDTTVKVIYKNADSGHILSKGLFPYEEFTITQEDWELSQSQDVIRSIEYDGYIDMKMIVKQVDSDKIIFAPQENDSFYSNDESLCLCLDSVYADDIKLPHQIEEGDVFVLRVDGSYALHEDGDDIPDIAPVAMIPEKYYEYLILPYQKATNKMSI